MSTPRIPETRTQVYKVEPNGGYPWAVTAYPDADDPTGRGVSSTHATHADAIEYAQDLADERGV